MICLDTQRGNEAFGAYSESLIRLCYQIYQTSLLWYPNLKLEGDEGDWPQTPQRWNQFTYDMAMNEESDKLTPSLRLLLDESGYIDDIVVRDYLNLLRGQCPSNIIIANPRELETPLQLTAPKDGLNCIHWFDSRPHSSTSKDLTSPIPVSCWTGPKQSQGQDHDSGLFMLLGIRRIASGYPPINDVQASRMVPHFRSTVFVGLLAKKLMPDEKEQQELGIDFSEGFFRDQFNVLKDTSAVLEVDSSGQLAHETSLPDTMVLDTPLGDIPTTHLNARRATAADAAILDTPMSDTPITASHEDIVSPASNSSITHSTRSRSGTRPPDSAMSETPMSDMATGHRAITPLDDPPTYYEITYDIMWFNEFKYSRRSTASRYYGVRFYREFVASKRSLKWSIGLKEFERMEKAQSKLRFWAELYECHKDLGARIASTLLCAFSDDHKNMSQAKQAEVIGITRARLNNREDTTLWSDLKKAERLCSAVLHCSLSDELLVIEGYSSWKVADLNDAVYKAFVSTDPHVKLPIEPYISR
ncbi:hypothetical protein QBC37DRAFT_404797 [Rhypophila decipiens]|uniref:Uncharacterized protein n=1 Tax=Rhypophila decipiens TaxID=261697 RepID=A0AAN6Y0D0_9PEZI|nr:hypothetical protein QBC37DRAFT_404797 [Rhypophila decipiens]